MIFAGPILALIFGHFLSKKKKLTLWYNASSGSPSCLQSWNHGWSDGFILQNLVNFFIHRMSDFGYNLKKKAFYNFGTNIGKDLKSLTGRLFKISRSCSMEEALAMTLWEVELRKHQAMANCVSEQPSFSAMMLKALILDWVCEATSTLFAAVAPIFKITIQVKETNIQGVSFNICQI